MRQRPVVRRARCSTRRAAWVAALAALAALGGGPVAADAAATAPRPIDLDQFDRQRRDVLLGNGLHLAYLERGDPHGPAVVLVHGYTDSAQTWVPLLPYLAPQLRLILVDLRGHGRSDKPECCYTRVDFAYDIKLLLDRLRIERAAVVGHSLGSIVAQTLAEHWPARVGRVALISSTAGPMADFATPIRALREPIDPNSPFMIDWWSSPTPVDLKLLRRLREDSARIPLRVWLAVLDQGLTAMDLAATLPRLVAPTLLIWGREDPLMGAAARASLQAALPHAQVRIFDGYGHNLFWENPQAVADVLNPFLRAEPPGGR
jgi:pimeloyl-ACP methyl ester carboxylesterase